MTAPVGSLTGSDRAAHRVAQPTEAPPSGVQPRTGAADALLPLPIGALQPSTPPSSVTDEPRSDRFSSLGTTMSQALASTIGSHITLHGGLGDIRERAQQVRSQLGEQPLPISNHSSKLILKLFGG